MVMTVNAAFKEFMRDKVNLDAAKTSVARKSRDFLREKVELLEDFFPLYIEKNIDFGSFARRTKIRPLDDIDLIFTLSARGCTWDEASDGLVYINTPEYSAEYKNYRHENSYQLNSRKIINRFISKLSSLPHYDKAKLHRNENAATLKLTSYEWNFDIVPAFFTTEDVLGNSYYLIPDGKGHWMKTDPRKDRQRVTNINQTCKGQVLNVIRAIKYWQNRPTMPSISSYLLENLVLNYFEHKGDASEFVDIEVTNILLYISGNIWHAVYDPKGVQGNLNTLSYDDKFKISEKARKDSDTALAAWEFEKIGDHEKAIKEWQQIFGAEFPLYG